MFMNYIDKTHLLKIISKHWHELESALFLHKVTYDKSFCFPFELDMQAKLFFSCFVLGEVRFQLDQTYFSFSLSEPSFQF